MSETPAPIYQLHVTLQDSQPPIWRRIQVPGDTSLARLHDMLQVVMGWQDYHLHQFTVGPMYYGVPDPEDFHEVRDERQVTLSQAVPTAQSQFHYEYDFGDSWAHTLLVEEILPAVPGQRYPICLAGQRAGPPEDVGGIGGYYHFLAALRDPQHPEHDEYREWLGVEFDPAAFDLDAVNAALQTMGTRSGAAVHTPEALPRLGKLPPQYNFILNPYAEYRFTSCPGCAKPTRLRKVPLFILADPAQGLIINHACRYCPSCDLLIVHQNEIEEILEQLFAGPAATAIIDEYVVVGAVERAFWRQSLKQPPKPPEESQEILEHLHDFKEIRRLVVQPAGWYRADEP